MSSSTLNNNLFLDKSKAPHKEGIIDVGKNCSKCNQLDFLPFTCEGCGLIFCSEHRTFDAHECTARREDKARKSVNYSGPTAASLFPDRDADKQKINSSLSSPKPTNIIEKQFRLGDVAKVTPNAFSKFNKFLKLQKDKKSKTVISRLFGNSSSSSSKTAKSKAVELVSLRKTAKGDAKIPVGDRIYVWCLFVNPHKSDNEASEIEKFTEVNQEKDRKALFVSKSWSAGRALDSIAEILHIGNYNNSTRESSERLNIFKVDDETPKLIPFSDKCSKQFANGDFIYLVKGSI